MLNSSIEIPEFSNDCLKSSIKYVLVSSATPGIAFLYVLYLSIKSATGLFLVIGLPDSAAPGLLDIICSVSGFLIGKIISSLPSA